MRVQSLVSKIASDLNDNEDGHAYQTWPAEQIRGWIVEGVSLVYEKRPDLFVENKIIQVTPCSIIQDTCDCDIIRRVVGQVTERGRLLHPLRERGLEVSFQWTGKPCRRKGDFRLESYAIDTETDRLYLWPEVPPHIDVHIKVECAVRPSADAEDINSAYDTAVTQWVLWRAKGMDMEVSTAATNAAQIHYKAFFDLLGLSIGAQTVIHKRDKT
jgi:hypothetical protein